MRKIGSFPDENAQYFLDYLIANQMPAQISPAPGGGFDLWIVEEDHFAQAKDEFAQFQAAPQDLKYRSATKKAEQVRNEQLAKVRQYKKNVVKANQLRKTKLPPVTISVLVISIVIFMITRFQFDVQSPTFQALTFMSAPLTSELNDLSAFELQSYSLAKGEIWRAITPAFLHANFMHIIFNMGWLILLGSSIERHEGPRFYLLLLFLTACIPNLLQGLMPEALDGTGARRINADHVLVVFGGFSGVAYGLFGFAWMRGSQRFVPAYMFTPATVVIAVAWLMMGIVGLDQTILHLKMANWAHGGGLVIGMILASLPLGRTATR